MTEAEAVATSTSAVSQDIQQVAPRLDTVSFAVYTGWDEPDTALPVDDKGIVGTIVFLKNSVMVWFGWGQLQPAANVAVSAGSDTTATTRSVGQGMCRMYYYILSFHVRALCIVHSYSLPFNNINTHQIEYLINQRLILTWVR
jgi:hypothetical protein